VFDECHCLLLVQARIAELEDELESERAGRVKVTYSFNYFFHYLLFQINNNIKNHALI